MKEKEVHPKQVKVRVCSGHVPLSAAAVAAGRARGIGLRASSRTDRCVGSSWARTHVSCEYFRREIAAVLGCVGTGVPGESLARWAGGAAGASGTGVPGGGPALPAPAAAQRTVGLQVQVL